MQGYSHYSHYCAIVIVVIIQDIVSELMDVSVAVDDSTATMALQCLANLSVTLHITESFTKVIQSLYNLLDSHHNRRLYVCRVLVNLSSHGVLVPYLLAAKVTPNSTAQFILFYLFVQNWTFSIVNR